MHDVIIIGSGAAGMTAAIYSVRYRLDTIVIGKLSGGLANEAHLVENWPGDKGISGMQLMANFREHASDLGAKFIDKEVISLSKIEGGFKVTTHDEEFTSKTIILALGTYRRRLNLELEAELIGKGVSYCATCDAPFFKDKVVGVVGGNDSAVMSANHLCQFAKKIYIIYRKAKLRAEPVHCQRAEVNPKIETIYNSNILRLNGENALESVTLDKEYNGSTELKLDGLFVEIGSVPAVALTKPLGICYDDSGYIQVEPTQCTCVKGVFAAGDITTGSGKFRQIITAAAEGAIAARSAYTYIDNELQ